MIRRLALGIAASAAGLALVAARPLTYAVPPDNTPAELASPDAELVVINCSACHSLDYIVTQPRGKGADFWRASVTKMVTVYKAPVSPEDAETIARILAGKFG